MSFRLVKNILQRAVTCPAVVKGYYSWQGNKLINRNDALGALYRSWGYVYSNLLDGDYYEFGVYQGDSLYRSFLLHSVWKDFMKNSPRPQVDEYVNSYINNFEPIFHAFDTFGGMPGNDEGVEVHGGSFMTSLDSVRSKCESYGLLEPRSVYYKGLFSEHVSTQITKPDRKPAAIINIDCDLYESTCDALMISEGIIQQGTVLLLDDYNLFCSSNKKGERRALSEFSERTGITFEPWFSYQNISQACICHKV